MNSISAAAAPLEVLVVGAGAVGQVYGSYLARGGARVSFFVRERYREAAQREFSLLRLRRKRQRPVALPFSPAAVLCTPQEMAAARFDQVYLTIASTGLDDTWLAPFIAALGDATLIGLTPSPGDRDRILGAGMSAERLVTGMISLVSYHAPLPDDPTEVVAGTTVWFPPGAPSVFSGPSARTQHVVDALRVGGLPAKVHPDVPRASAFLSNALMPYLLALEAASWSFRQLRSGDRLAAATSAAREAVAISERQFGRAPLPLRFALHPSIIRMVLRLAPRLTPFALESYLRTHFTKVGAQTRLIVTLAIAQGSAAGLPVAALKDLLTGVCRAS